jgi:hypothetical protein
LVEIYPQKLRGKDKHLPLDDKPSWDAAKINNVIGHGDCRDSNAARLNRLDYGSAVPDFDLTVEMSELLIKPLTVTSVRKVLELAPVPLCAFALWSG